VLMAWGWLDVEARDRGTEPGRRETAYARASIGRRPGDTAVAIARAAH